MVLTRSRTILRRALCASVALTMLLMSGCESSPPATPGGGSVTTVPGNFTEPIDGRVGVTARWPFWPQRMRIHPLTMFVTDRTTGSTMLELRIEFIDEFGHTTKHSGAARIELHNSDPRDPGAGRIQFWNYELRTAEENVLHYDPVTQTYLFRVDLESQELPDDPYVTMMFIGIDGRTFDVQQRVRDLR